MLVPGYSECYRIAPDTSRHPSKRFRYLPTSIESLSKFLTYDCHSRVCNRVGGGTILVFDWLVSAVKRLLHSCQSKTYVAWKMRP